MKFQRVCSDLLKFSRICTSRLYMKLSNCFVERRQTSAECVAYKQPSPQPLAIKYGRPCRIPDRQPQRWWTETVLV